MVAVQAPWTARVEETLTGAIVAERAGADLDPDVRRPSVDDEPRPGAARRHIQILSCARDLDCKAGNSEMHRRLSSGAERTAGYRRSAVASAWAAATAA